LILFALTPAYTVALGLLVLMGVAQTFSLTNMAVLLLGTASSDMRGRVMGLRSLAVAPLFVGGTLAGAATTRIGAPLTTIACAVIGLLIVLWVAPRIPRHMEV
jgi:sugar phosphate permease